MDFILLFLIILIDFAYNFIITYFIYLIRFNALKLFALILLTFLLQVSTIYNRFELKYDYNNTYNTYKLTYKFVMCT